MCNFHINTLEKRILPDVTYCNLYQKCLIDTDWLVRQEQLWDSTGWLVSD